MSILFQSTTTGLCVEPAGMELSSGQIRERYGSLIAGAVSAFRSDSQYLVEMAEHASMISYKRKAWEARVEAARLAARPEDIPALYERIIEQRGLVSPRRPRRKRTVA